MKITSWNVNGIRSVWKKGFEESIQKLGSDIICIQESKAQDEIIEDLLSPLDEYSLNSYSAERKGYSGTILLSKKKIISLNKGIGVPEFDDEGRVLTAEFKDFYLTNVYVPNSGNGLVRLEYRKYWDMAFLKYLKSLEVKKPVIVCGDFNVAHQAMDLARPKPNYNKTAGYTQQEIDGFTEFLNSGFVDVYRTLNPEKIEYTFWSYRLQARMKNIGWRIDYFLCSKKLFPQIKKVEISKEIEGSDHCPISMEI